METEIQLISDGDGLAVIGEPSAVELFLASEGLESRDLALPRLSSVLSAGGVAAQAGSEIAENSGRWVKLTKESSELIKKHGLRESKKTGLSTGVVTGDKGRVKGFVEFATGPGKGMNPAMLSGAAGMMAQLAMQQTMAEITDYLARIDEKLDEVLRSQTHAVLARMDGVELAIREAMSVRESVGRVSEVTWSKVQASSSTILDTQAYALRQMKDLTEKLERKRKVGDLTKTTREAEADVQKWLAVLARCFHLQDAIAVLELDRVLDASPEELDRHRLGLRAARKDRLQLISGSTMRLIARMDTAAGTANAKVLLHPSKAPALVAASNQVSGSVLEFHGLLGIEHEREALDARRWRTAASEVRAKALDKGADGVDAAKRVAGKGIDRAKSATGKVSSRIADREFLRRDRDEDPGRSAE